MEPFGIVTTRRRPSAAVSPTPEVLKITGTGSKNTKRFDLLGGDYSIVFSGKSKDDYALAGLTLYSGGGEYIDLLVNEIVDHTGKWKFDTNLYAVDPGAYYLEVDAPKGTWSVVIAAQQ